MRKNRTKHEAKKPRLAKRALALCFALIFVCSCLLPVFAHSEEGLLELSVSSEQSVGSEQPTNPTEGGEDPVLLTEGGEDSNEEPKNEEPKPVEPEQKPAEPEQKPEEPKVEEQPKTEGATEESKDTTGETKPEEPKTEETKPEEPKTEGTTESKDSTEEQPKPEGTTEETKPEEPKQPTTNTTGDTINQGEATYTYRFWPKEIDAFDLEAINDAVKKGGESLNDAAQSRVNMVPCTILTVKDHAYLGDYKANVQQPTKPGYEFAGWYTVDGTTEDEFSFEQNLNFEKSKTIDVFAKWNELVTLQTTVTVDVDATLFGGEAAISLADEYSYEDDRMAAPTKTLTLDVKATNLSGNSELSVSSASSSAIEDYCDDNELVPILTLDITPKDKDSGKKTEPQETSTVTIRGLSELELPDKLTMVHKKDNGEIEEIPAQYSNGTLTFKATSFSTYAVAAAATMDSPLETRYMEGRTIYSNKRVFLYVKVEGDTSDLVLNNDGWYTLGYVDLDNSLTMHNRDYVGYWEKTWGAAANAYSTSGDNWNKVITALGGSNQSVLGWGTNSKVTRYTKNNSIALKDVKWNQAGYGLVATKGATDYDGYVNGTYYGVNGNQYIAWHLDGYLRADEFTSYTVNYYAMVNGEPIFVKKVSRDVPVDTVIYAKDFEDETLSYDDGTYYNNGTYKFDHHDKEQITAVKKGENVINLYYRDTSKKYPLFLFAKMSKTVMEKLNKANSDLNSDEWFTLGYIEDSGLPEPESKAPNPKYKEENQKYNTAVGKLSTETVHRYPQNSNVNLDDITWNYEDIDGVQFGLTTAGGANDYADPNHSTEINGETITENTRTWHLDGYIANLGAIVVNYYIEGTEDRLQPSVTHLGSPNRSYTLIEDEKPDSLTKGSVTYKLKNIVPSETQQFPENDVAIINLYYERVVDPSNIPDSGESFIVVEKRFSGLTENTIPKDFKITVGNTEYDLDSGNGVQIGNDYVVRWKITGVNAGSYTIKESGYDKPGYKTEAKVTGSTATFDPVAGTTVRVEVPTLDSFHATVTTPKKNASYDVKMEGTTNTIFVGRLTGKVGNGLIVFTKEPLSYAQREAIKNVLKTYPMENGGTWGKNNTEVHFYSVDEQLKNGGFNIDGSYVTYSSNGKITFSDQGIWSMVATATYSTTDAQNPEVSITNTYTLNTTNVTITKKTTGAFADRAKAFEFTVSGLNVDATLDGHATGNSVTFNLANGNSKTIENLKVGQTITIMEDMNDSKDYDTTADGHAKVNAGGEKSFQYEVCLDVENGEIYLKPVNGKGVKITAVGTDTNKKLGITVTNDFDGTPDTGVLLDTLPYLILLAVAVAGGVLVVVRKRKHRDE
mgnify:CR=1 FL=1